MNKKKLSHSWFVFLQSEICKQFLYLENKGLMKYKKFNKKTWKKDNPIEGGGTSYILKNGNVFDKVGVNQSTVSGIFKKNFRSKIPGAKKNGKYWASGISVVAHFKNPKIPALHFNTRFISTSKNWFGGGVDATPCFQDKSEKENMHKKSCQVTLTAEMQLNFMMKMMVEKPLNQFLCSLSDQIKKI